MSRSHRKNPIFSNACARSEKRDKRWYNRAMRRANKALLSVDPEREILLDKKDVSDPWCMNKDGKHRWRDIIKDTLWSEYKKFMAK